ncbi:hypothetical protein C8R45DRAFT_939771 [Mycena sanguinolenta]|nr:hypothetical protein C8R45DRAFT_939771 [Mycena sanguinolenta]
MPWNQSRLRTGRTLPMYEAPLRSPSSPATATAGKRVREEAGEGGSGWEPGTRTKDQETRTRAGAEDVDEEGREAVEADAREETPDTMYTFPLSCAALRPLPTNPPSPATRYETPARILRMYYRRNGEASASDVSTGWIRQESNTHPSLRRTQRRLSRRGAARFAQLTEQDGGSRWGALPSRGRDDGEGWMAASGPDDAARDAEVIEGGSASAVVRRNRNTRAMRLRVEAAALKQDVDPDCGKVGARVGMRMGWMTAPMMEFALDTHFGRRGLERTNKMGKTGKKDTPTVFATTSRTSNRQIQNSPDSYVIQIRGRRRRTGCGETRLGRSEARWCAPHLREIDTLALFAESKEWVIGSVDRLAQDNRSNAFRSCVAMAVAAMLDSFAQNLESTVTVARLLVGENRAQKSAFVVASTLETG